MGRLRANFWSAANLVLSAAEKEMSRSVPVTVIVKLAEAVSVSVSWAR